MQVKGTGIKTTRDFVKIKFPNRFDEWVNSLPAESKKLYTGIINVGGWFDIKPAYYDPMSRIVEMFYTNNPSLAGEELGRFSADIALKGIYKVFLLVATPQYLMKKASSMMEAFYHPSEIEITETSSKQVVFKIKKFEGINLILEHRAAGWCVRALELCNCKNPSYKINSHLSTGQNNTTIEFKWE